MEKRMSKTVLLMTIVLLVSCSLTERSDNIAANQQASGCGGFAGLSRRRAIPDSFDSTDYCSAEKIRWQYRENASILELLLTRNLQNCAAEPAMEVTRSGETFVISVSDKSDPNVQANCVCYFDMYAELDHGVTEAMEFRYRDTYYTIDPGEGEGVLITDTSTSWPCR
jgi:hypothetical protein